MSALPPLEQIAGVVGLIVAATGLQTWWLGRSQRKTEAIRQDALTTEKLAEMLQFFKTHRTSLEDIIAFYEKHELSIVTALEETQQARRLFGHPEKMKAEWDRLLNDLKKRTSGTMVGQKTR